MLIAGNNIIEKNLHIRCDGSLLIAVVRSFQTTPEFKEQSLTFDMTSSKEVYQDLPSKDVSTIKKCEGHQGFLEIKPSVTNNKKAI